MLFGMSGELLDFPGHFRTGDFSRRSRKEPDADHAGARITAAFSPIPIVIDELAVITKHDRDAIAKLLVPEPAIQARVLVVRRTHRGV
jgi:hypothetical protein